MSLQGFCQISCNKFELRGMPEGYSSIMFIWSIIPRVLDTAMNVTEGLPQLDVHHWHFVIPVSASHRFMFASTTPSVMAGFTMMMEAAMSNIAVTDACLELSYEDVEMVKALQDPQHELPSHCQTRPSVRPTDLCPLFQS